MITYELITYELTYTDVNL